MKTNATLQSFASLLALCCLTACAVTSQVSSGPKLFYATDCDTSSVKKNVTINYGDGHLSVDVKEQKVKRTEYLAFKLKPDSSKGPGNLDYKTVIVTISGKDSAAQWIVASGKAEEDDLLEVCVPTDVAYGIYEYVVQVNSVGLLDPRVDVVQ